MSAIDKTANLLRIRNFPLSLMDKNEANPNKMRPREFDLLCDNMIKTGWTDPVLARAMNLKALEKLAAKAGTDEDKIVSIMIKEDMRIRIVGGHHRYDAAAFLGFEYGPATIIMDPEFDDEQETYQMVRMNVIRGRMDPSMFIKMYQDFAQKYSDDILQESFGFADEAEFRRLIIQLANTLPDKPTQDKFKQQVAAQEIKTITGLSQLLNHMFTTYGDTLPYGYMFIDYGGHRSVWLRVSDKTMKAMDIVADICVHNQRTMDDILGRVVQLIALPESSEFVASIVAETPPVKIPTDLQGPPTKDHLQKIEAAA